MSDSDETELCIRWGEGKDRCIRHYDHIGDCQNEKGETTTSIREALYGKPPDPEFD